MTINSKRGQRFLASILALLLTLLQPAAILADDPAAPSGGGSSGSTSAPASGGTTAPAASGSSPSSPSGSGTTQQTPPASGSTAPSASSSPAAPASAGSPSPAGSQSTGAQGATGPQQATGSQGPTGPIPDYAFNDATRHWDPTIQSSFSWNQALGRYVSPLYSYNATTGWYHVIPAAAGRSVASFGAPARSASAANNPAATLAQLLGLSDPSNSNTGPGSTNSALSSTSTSAMLSLLANALINNNDTSTANSGNAAVSGNTVGGDAASGAASIIENLLNLLNAAWSWSGGGLSYFAQNLFGNQTGDITINPTTSGGSGGQIGSTGTTGGLSANSTTGPGSTNTAAGSDTNNLTVVNKPTGAINNNVDLLAQSGNAAVQGNTKGGSASSGDATVDLNILNLINSAINSGSSFFGLLNIFGNLNGDVLFPNGFLDSATGSSNAGQSGSGSTTATNGTTGPGSTNTAGSSTNNNFNVTNSPSAAFNNNVNTAAKSGAASVDGNTSAGSATSGDSTTKNNLFNLFNSNVFGDNAVLVLVNVMGHWVGHIMNLPDSGSSTGALLTGNAVVSNNATGPNSTNTANESQNNNVNLVNQPSGTITNNVRAGAISGAASVSGNTTGGNATSGVAKVATNIANIFGSALNLKKWFGVLVINVFGDWTGSVGDNTAAGNGSASSATSASSTSSTSGGSGSGSGHTTAAGSISHSSLGTGSASNAKPGSGVNINSAATSPNVSTGNQGGSLVGALAASVHTPQAAAKTAAKATGLLIVLTAIMLLLAGGAYRLERRAGLKR